MPSAIPASNAAPDHNARALMAFLQRFPPFSQMEPGFLAQLVERSELRYFADGDVVLDPKSGPVEHFFIVKKGQIRGERRVAEDQPETTFEISEGECFPLAALLGERATRTLHRAMGDTFCLALPKKDFLDLFAECEPFRDFCLRGVSALLDQVNKRIQARSLETLGSQSSLDTPLEQFALRNPIVCSPDTPLQKAIGRMHDANVGSIIVTDDQRRPTGIFTLRDLRRIVAENHGGLERPIHACMTSAPLALEQNQPAFQAALLMAEHHFGHLCIVNGDGELVGVVSERDLFALQRVDLVQLTRTIATAPNLQTLVGLRDDVQRLVEAMLARGAAADQILRLVTTLNDATVRRVLELRRAELPTDVPFTWMVFGSEARSEQTLLTDQDNAILFDCPDGIPPEAIREQLLPWARQVNEDLAACGFTLCKGHIMASNPKLCLSRKEWKQWYQSFLASTTPENLLNSTIFLDVRPVWGPPEPVESLVQEVFTLARKHTLFQKMLADHALQNRPPLSVFRSFIAALPGKHQTIDLKAEGLAPMVDAIRVLALANSITEPNTLERLRALVRAGVVEPQDANAWSEAYELIQLIRMRHHQDLLRKGRPLDNRIDPEQLNPLDRRILRESFRQAQRLQRKLEHSYPG
ncbi:putative nucleotidyltransferase substrate binding domain-containing protein [Marinobacteraceae bacterium S3BR75-40.1]